MSSPIGRDGVDGDRAVRSFEPGDEAGIRAVMEASLAVDRLPGFTPSDIDRLLVRVPADPASTAVALEDRRVVGYCAPRFDDLTVHPAFRRRGHGRRLAAAGLDIARRLGLPFLELHGPTHLPATRAFIDALGFRYHSSLWRFELAPEIELPPPAFPPEVRTRTYRPDEDLERHLDLLDASFADHPTPVSWSLETIRQVNAQPDFDRHGVLLVTPADDPSRLIAFGKFELNARHGTDRHGQPRGTVGLVGVRPEWRRRGIGRELLRWGVAYLRGRGAGVIELSVEALNEGATRIYRAAGFVPAIEWPHFVVPTAGPTDSGASAA